MLFHLLRLIVTDRLFTNERKKEGKKKHKLKEINSMLHTTNKQTKRNNNELDATD